MKLNVPTQNKDEALTKIEMENYTMDAHCLSQRDTSTEIFKVRRCITYFYFKNIWCSYKTGFDTNFFKLHFIPVFLFSHCLRNTHEHRYNHTPLYSTDSSRNFLGLNLSSLKHTFKRNILYSSCLPIQKRDFV